MHKIIYNTKNGGVIIKKDKYKNIKDWFPIRKINNNNIFTKDGKSIKLFKVEPINFKLKSDGEKSAILSAYKQFLKTCNFDMQIIIQTDSVNIEKHFSDIDAFKIEEPDLANMAEDYKKLIKNITKERESISRKFYIATSNKNTNVKEKLSTCLINCGNVLNECSNLETMQIFRRCLKKNSALRKDVKWV